MNLIELMEKRKSLSTELENIVVNGEQEKRKLTETEEQRFNEIQSEIKSVDEQINNKNKKTENKNMKEKFSLLRAIEARANGVNLDDISLEVINKGKEEARKAGISPSGDIVIPLEYRADLTVAAESEVVAENKLTVLEPLKNSLVLSKAGAQVITGLIGDFAIPTYSGTNSAWEGETDEAADGAGTFSDIKFSPKRLSTYIDISKKFLVQDSVAAEEMLMRDIVNAIALKLESTILGSVSGDTTQPAGIFYNVSEITGSTLYETVVNLETEVDTQNALTGKLAYITTPSAKGTLKTTNKVSGQNGYVLEGSELNGYPVYSSNNVSSGKIVFGNWNDLIIAQWGALDLTVDNLTLARSGKVRIVINSYWDAKFRRSESYSVASVA